MVPTFAKNARMDAFDVIAGLIGGLAVLGYFVLVTPWKAMPSALIYSFVPFLLWSALRFGGVGVSISMIVISFLSIGEPFMDMDPLQALNLLKMSYHCSYF